MGNFNLASEKRLLKGACGVKVTKLLPRGGRGGGVLEQHRLTYAKPNLGVQIRINIFGVWRFFRYFLGITCKLNYFLGVIFVNLDNETKPST